MADQQRLPEPFGCFINRDKTIRFSFEGDDIIGIEGDTISSALIAQGQWLQSRSFKYHRPRGPLTMAGQDANTLVQIPNAPNTMGDRYNISDNLEVKAQNYTGSLRRDWMSVLGYFSRFLPVGFYYKAFFRPKGIWALWAKFIRRRAGLGVIDQSLVTGSGDAVYDKQYKFADVVVVGGGPAGMSAALAAANSSAEVILVDEHSMLGGSMNYSSVSNNKEADQRLRQDLIQAVEKNPNIEVLLNTTCNGCYTDNWLALVSRRRLYKLRAKEVILCVGSLEQPAIFRGNDIPGVVMSSAALRLIKLYAVKPGQRAVVLAGNDEAYKAAAELLAAGVEIVLIAELRNSIPDTEFARLISNSGVPIKTSCTVFEAKLNRETLSLGSVEIRALLEHSGNVIDGECAESGQNLACDLLCMSVGYMPAWQLPCMVGANLSYDDYSADFTLSNLPNSMQLAGSVNGAWLFDEVIEQGRVAGLNAAGKTVTSVTLTKLNLNHPWPIFPHPKGKEFVDFDEDLQIADIVNATRDGYENIQLVKRYSTCGMGPSQGRHSALAAARIVARATQKTVAETGVTTARPPFSAEELVINAGRSFYPERKTNMHYRHLEMGAQMMQAGAWHRPAYYGGIGDADESISNEVNRVRNGVGLIDVSTLGGLDVRGPDAAEFLNRFYTFTFTKLAVGQSRYALLTNEAGVVIDDGIAARLHAKHFYVTATTGGVERVFQSMLKWNAQWGMDVDISNVTTAWCGVNLAGPASRDVIEKLVTDIDFSRESFPYMGVRQGTLAGIPIRALRVGFVGELGFELHAPQQYGEALWDALIKAGEEFQIAPFGVESQRLLRLEKGHIIIGQDTDAMSNPMELQMNWAIARKKPFFIGGRTIRELGEIGIKRVLVGFSMQKGSAAEPKENCLVLEGEDMVGRVTSCALSPTLDKIIGLAYVPIAASQVGTSITIKCEGNMRVNATVCDLPFYDPQSERQDR